MGDFVGRRAELTALAGGLAALSSGRAAWAHVVGEPGIGKSRLLRELCETARGRGARVLAGRGAELERDVPFGLIADACDDYLRTLDEPELLARCGRQVLDLLPIFPALSGLGRPDPAHPSPGGPAGAGTGSTAGDTGLTPGGLSSPDRRFRAHRALRGLLERVAAQAPLALVLDDVHWADAASVEALEFLLRHPPEAPVFVVLAWRPGQASPLADTLAVAAGSLPGTALTLGGLDEQELADLFGKQLDGRAVRALHRASGGNPFYAQALAASISDGQRAGWDGHGPAGPADIPHPVVAAIRQEIGGLPMTVRLLAQGAAVAGEPFEPDLAAACAGVTGEAALAGLDQLVSLGIVRPADGPRRFAFRHPIVLRVVYDCAGPGWRLAAHARAAAALAERGTPITTQAHHVALAASAGDLPAAALLASAAAEVSARAPASAADWLEAALQLLPGHGRAAQRRDLLVSLARVRTTLGDLPAAHQAWLRALDLVSPGEPEPITLVAGCAGVELGLGQWQAARSRLTAALAALPASQPAARAIVCLELAGSWLATLDFSQAAEYATQAVTLTAATDRLLWATAAGFLALVRAMTEQTAAARPLAAEAAAVLDGLTDAELAPCLDALLHLGWAERLLEDYPAAVAHLGRGIALAEEHGGSPYLIPAMAEQAKVLAECGRVGEGQDLIETAVEMARLSGLALPLVFSMLGKVAVLAAAGDLAPATTTAADARQLGSYQVDYLVTDVRRRLALGQLEAGHPDRFLAELAALDDPGVPTLAAGTRCELLEARTQAELALGRPAAAEQNAAAAERAAARLGLPVSTALACRARSRVLAVTSPADALCLAQHAMALFDEAGARVQAARTRVLLGTVLAALGRRADAVREIGAARAALASYGALGSADHAGRLQRRLRRGGPAARGGTDVGPGSLSRREREIAELVARGLTNRDIAAELHISAKTVETHLSRILAKLGVPGRAAVARAMAAPASRQETGA